ncbi:MAG: hypothetical protein ACYS30_19815 [Planctomycetota bacterium]|jgi:hypothetical protein
MSFTPDEIKSIEIIVEGIEKVVEVISQQLKQFVYDRSTKTHRLREGKTVKNICKDVYMASGLYLTLSDPPSNLIRDILAKLYWDKPEIAKDLKERYYRHISDVSQLFKIKDADNLYGGLFSVQYELSELAQALRAGSKIAKAETEKPAETERNTTPTICWRLWSCVKRIPRWICGLVIAVFFAVIAAIVVEIFADFGWLERITNFIYKILQLK